MRSRVRGLPEMELLQRTHRRSAEGLRLDELQETLEQLSSDVLRYAEQQMGLEAQVTELALHSTRFQEHFQATIREESGRLARLEAVMEAQRQGADRLSGDVADVVGRLDARLLDFAAEVSTLRREPSEVVADCLRANPRRQPSEAQRLHRVFQSWRACLSCDYFAIDTPSTSPERASGQERMKRARSWQELPNSEWEARFQNQQQEIQKFGACVMDVLSEVRDHRGEVEAVEAWQHLHDATPALRMEIHGLETALRDVRSELTQLSHMCRQSEIQTDPDSFAGLKVCVHELESQHCQLQQALECRLRSQAELHSHFEIKVQSHLEERLQEQWECHFQNLTESDGRRSELHGRLERALERQMQVQVETEMERHMQNEIQIQAKLDNRMHRHHLELESELNSQLRIQLAESLHTIGEEASSKEFENRQNILQLSEELRSLDGSLRSVEEVALTSTRPLKETALVSEITQDLEHTKKHAQQLDGRVSQVSENLESVQKAVSSTSSQLAHMVGDVERIEAARQRRASESAQEFEAMRTDLSMFVLKEDLLSVQACLGGLSASIEQDSKRIEELQLGREVAREAELDQELEALAVRAQQRPRVAQLAEQELRLTLQEITSLSEMQPKLQALRDDVQNLARLDDVSRWERCMERQIEGLETRFIFQSRECREASEMAAETGAQVSAMRVLHSQTALQCEECSTNIAEMVEALCIVPELPLLPDLSETSLICSGQRDSSHRASISAPQVPTPSSRDLRASIIASTQQHQYLATYIVGLGQSQKAMVQDLSTVAAEVASSIQFVEEARADLKGRQSKLDSQSDSPNEVQELRVQFGELVDDSVSLRRQLLGLAEDRSGEPWQAEAESQLRFEQAHAMVSTTSKSVGVLQAEVQRLSAKVDAGGQRSSRGLSLLHQAIESLRSEHRELRMTMTGR